MDRALTHVLPAQLGRCFDKEPWKACFHEIMAGIVGLWDDAPACLLICRPANSRHFRPSCNKQSPHTSRSRTVHTPPAPIPVPGPANSVWRRSSARRRTLTGITLQDSACVSSRALHKAQAPLLQSVADNKSYNMGCNILTRRRDVVGWLYEPSIWYELVVALLYIGFDLLRICCTAWISGDLLYNRSATNRGKWSLGLNPGQSVSQLIQWYNGRSCLGAMLFTSGRSHGALPIAICGFHYRCPLSDPITIATKTILQKIINGAWHGS